MRNPSVRRTKTVLRRLVAAAVGLGCLLAGETLAQSRDARCVAPNRLEIGVVWDSARGVVADLGREFSTPGFNQGCPLVMSPQSPGRETHRWTFYGRAGILNYKNEFGTHDDAGGFGIKRTGPKVGTITFGIRKEF
ncbi:MAG: hypothetical protein ACT4P4_29440 [Betaproteobacteria bacterium]